ncbi:hypothetical protein OCS_00388 [Ophiocordyceps sinensis CO18]|uniref:Uncharacterized protein n=1 Tax=Ophiocordyceps sinensis (strain Co18 / CGMCC 3.14243) TaxID=911162 RepID=T5AEK5_OPHSC|nr:hypothetical protein OCS_00388 [Ophiocordyceps sinensis CO18]
MAGQEALAAGRELEPVLVQVVEPLSQHFGILTPRLTSETLLDSMAEVGEPSWIERGRLWTLGFRRFAVRDAGAQGSRRRRLRTSRSAIEQ